MKISDAITAKQQGILISIRNVLKGRKDYETKIKSQLVRDFIDTKSLDAFIKLCIQKYHIAYLDLPYTYYEDADFLCEVCRSYPKFLSQIKSNPSMYYKVSDTLNHEKLINKMSKRTPKSVTVSATQPSSQDAKETKSTAELKNV